MDFVDIVTAGSQKNIREELVRCLAKRPMAITAHARSIGISHGSLGTFLRGNMLGRISLMKIVRFIEDSRGN